MGTSAGFWSVTSSSCGKTLNLRHALKYPCTCLRTGSNKKRIVCTHRGAICVGQREQNMLGGVDHGRPGQLCCYFRLHVLLKVCVDFKDGFNPWTRIDSILMQLIQQCSTMAKSQVSTCVRVSRVLFQLFPSSEELLVKVHVSVPDIFLQSQAMGLRLRCQREIFSFKNFVHEMHVLRKEKNQILTFKHKWQPHITVITTLQAGIKINICHLKRMEERK